MQDDLTEKKSLRINENNITAFNSIAKTDVPAQKPDLDLFARTDFPQLFESLAFLANHLRRNSLRNHISGLETIGIVTEKKLGETEWKVVDGTGDLDETANNRTLFMWKRVEKFLPTLPNDLARLDYLINIWARFNKMSEGARKTMNPDKDFSHNVSVEIERLEKLMQLGQSTLIDKKTQGYPPHRRKEIIDAAVYLTKKSFDWKTSHLVEKLNISEPTLDRLKRFFSLKIRYIRNEALAIIENENN